MPRSHVDNLVIRTLGYWWHGRGRGKVWLFDMQCTLGSCTHNGWGNVWSGCYGHPYDVGVLLIIYLNIISSLWRNVTMKLEMLKGVEYQWVKRCGLLDVLESLFLRRFIFVEKKQL